MAQMSESIVITESMWEMIRALPTTPRIAALHAEFERQYAVGGERCFRDPAMIRARDAAVLTAYCATVGEPPILRRARALAECAETLPVKFSPDELIIGLQTMNGQVASSPETAQERQRLGLYNTTGHIVHDYEALLRHGIGGCLAQIDDARRAASSEDARTNLAGFAQALAAFRRYIARHAELAETIDTDAWQTRSRDLRHLMEEPPATFAQALQMVWFAQVFLHIENPSSAISFGRIDQYLWPYLCDDLAAGCLDLAGALELICAFYIKTCEGDESQNATLGGVDADGHDASNVLSLLCIEAMRRLGTFQPSLTVRIHDQAQPVFIGAACELAAAGTGNPGFMQDAPVIDGLYALGIPLAQARDWAVVGCYEATVQGGAYPNTVLGRLFLVDAMADYLVTETARGAATFDEFLHGWYRQVAQSYATTLEHCQRSWNAMRELAPSPFGSVLMRDCVARATPLEAGGAPFSMAGINILGLGTVVDSLHAIREVVFTRHEMTLAELADAVAADFPDEGLRLRLQYLSGRYGTDSEETSALAHAVSSTIARMVLDSRLAHGVRPYPGFFAFSNDIYALNHASPDGRRKADFISYGVNPSTAMETSPTSVLRSAAHVAHPLCACGNPCAIALQRSDITGTNGVELIRNLVTTYFSMGGMHVHFNIVSADDLRKAKADPDQHADLTVRVSGYSARFITVESRWQDALIERAEKGM